MRTVDILGVKVDAVTAAEAVVLIRQGLDAGKRQSVVTPYSEIIMAAQHDLAYKEILNKATLRVPDGIGVVWAAHYLQRPLRGPFIGVRAYAQALWTLILLAIWPARVKTVIRETVLGSELTVDLAGMCEEFGYRLFLLGAAEGVAAAAAKKLKRQFPRLQVAGAMPGSPHARDDQTVVARIRQAKPDVLIVAYSPPEQEQWIARNLSKLPKPIVAMGAGGTFDYLTGATSIKGGRPAKQPPRWVRRRGYESFWRLFTQPRRWRRIMTGVPIFASHVVRYKRQAHRTA